MSDRPDGENPETTFHRLLIVRDVWLPGVQRWAKEYVGRKLNGELFDTVRRFASEFSATNDGPSKAESERKLAELYLHHSRATPWRIIRVKVHVKRKIRQGQPQEGDFASSPGLLSLQEWTGAVGGRSKKVTPPS
jgi:hypothetical protein